MKKISFLFFTVLFSLSAHAQYQLIYQTYRLGATGDTVLTEVLERNNKLKISDLNTEIANPIPGIANEVTYVDLNNNKVSFQLNYSNEEQYFCTYELENKELEIKFQGVEKINGYSCKKYSTSINSNSIDIWMTNDKNLNAMPLTRLGKIDGLMIKYCMNGNQVMELKSIKKNRKIAEALIPPQLGTEKSPRELSNLKKQKLIIEIPIFEDEQIHFADIKKFTGEVIPFDTTLHFSSGTVIVKRLRLPKLPPHYQIFAEITQISNGDAYDRSASVFVIPQNGDNSYVKALTDSLGALPQYTDKEGNLYQGIKLTNNYLPPIELVRFFTPFGIGKFNERVHIDGLEWKDKAYFKQEITDLAPCLSGDVLIGAFIGNYDQGGHKLSLRLLAYPQDYEWFTKDNSWTLPLFNTCNVLEMSGQNYGRLFRTDSLQVSFEIPKGVNNIKLRYISTGHGGWDTGDEFTQRENTIIVDGVKRFTHTPWRCDCATFREMNPVSGNFWNGTSSSDYSRSGWCPGTATQPVYFDLNDLKPGKHSITIAIPQGENEGSSFSHWMVSGILLGETQQ